MRRVRDRIPIPTATNTVVVGLEQLATCVRLDAVDVILLDTTFWSGLRQAVKAGAVCETLQPGVAVHSSGELGIQLATMLHLGAVLPNLRFSPTRTTTTCATTRSAAASCRTSTERSRCRQSRGSA